MFSNGRWSIPIAAWLFPVFFIRYFRTQRSVSRLIFGAILFVAAYVFISIQILSFEALSMAFRIGSGGAVGTLFLLPFMADRFIVPRVKGSISSLVFPFTWVAVEYLIGLVNGTWFSLAYTQYGNLPLMQVASVSGIWGISFLVTWFASMANDLYENEFCWSRIRTLLCVYTAILVAALIYGGARLSLFQPDSATTKVASILSVHKSFTDILFNPGMKGKEAIGNQMQKEQTDLLKRSKEAARQGAKIIVWQEYAISVLKKDEASFVNRAGDIARREGVYLIMALAIRPPELPNQPWENKLIWLDPEGNTIREYKKSKPAPPLEPIPAGDGIVPVVTTPFGKIAAVICADQNYPGLVRQAGRAGAGLLLVPSLDWKAVSPLHTQMGVFRAIENGCAMVKATGAGLSIAVDCQGRVLSALDYWNTNDRVMYSHVPTEHCTTIYQLIGDCFAWFCMLGASGFGVFALCRIGAEHAN